MSLHDQLAETATAPATPAAIASSTRETLGRFLVRAILGQGGMGVVHEAYDPELERKIALKLLRQTGSADARARLLREARAMAKLSHPNVITVFDVGSADGQDFVAMELIDGETLGEWIKRERPSWRAIVDAFILAGRGLAAAHAAGLIHRDFKPSNVLRSRSGKLVVTDFGLARAIEGADEIASRDTPRPGEIAQTATGAVLGTPAYMAPEQWTGKAVTAATDQFAFCVALWEALAGERPYRGETLEELRTGVLGGPSELAGDAVPRALRPILRRGLATAPGVRWPSMDALIAALARVGHRRQRMLGVAAVGILMTVCAGGFLFVQPQAQSVADCAPPVLDPDRAWTPGRVGALAARDPEAVTLVGNDVAAWRNLRARACSGQPAEKAVKLACLDATLARLDHVLGSALVDRRTPDADSLAEVLVDPQMCDRSTPPRLAPLTPELDAALAMRWKSVIGGPLDAAELALADTASTPCARALALIARVDNLDEREIPVNAGQLFRDIEALSGLALRCDDDPIKTSIAILQAAMHDTNEAMTAASVAFPQDDVRAGIEVAAAKRAADAERWDEADRGYARATELYGHRHRVRGQLEAIRLRIRALLERGRSEDVATVKQLYARWLPLSRGRGPKAALLEQEALELRWQLGDIASADAELEAMRARHELFDFRPPGPVPAPIDVSGEVVDEHGVPVAGATVDAALQLIGDSHTAAMPRAMTWFTMLRRTARTDQTGAFRIPGARGTIIAQSGGLRSRAASVHPHVRLVVEPTTHIAGTVALDGKPTHQVWVVARSDAADGSGAPTTLVAPVSADGGWSLDGVLRGKVRVGVTRAGSFDEPTQWTSVDSVRSPPIPLELSNAKLHVIARSADLMPPDGALIWLLEKFDPGPHPTLKSISKAKTLRAGVFAQPINLKHPPPELANKVQADDLYALIPNRPAGVLELCVVGFAKKQLSGTMSTEEFGKAMSDEEMGCKPVPADATVVTIEVPTIRKLQTN